MRLAGKGTIPQQLSYNRMGRPSLVSHVVESVHLMYHARV